jgi:DNA-binding SARP family transcriptional activator
VHVPVRTSEVRLAVHVLGPVAVLAGGVEVPVGRPLERALAARLALARGAPVPDGRLARDLWGDAELSRPAGRLRVLASRLRQALDVHAAALSRTGGGYALAAGAADLAAAEAAADRLHAAVRSGDHLGARAAAEQALAGWRGPAFADLRAVPFASREGERLDGWQLDLEVDRLAAELALGPAAAVSGTLERLAGEHPHHERLSGLLALALYRAGRPADALDRLARLRRTLADDLGIDPSPDLAALELRLLRHDPTLAAPTPPGRQAEPIRAAAAAQVGSEGDQAAGEPATGRALAGAAPVVTGPSGTGNTAASDPAVYFGFRRRGSVPGGRGGWCGVGRGGGRSSRRVGGSG